MKRFELKYFTRRWNSDVTLDVNKTETGWHISHIAINGETDPEGSPILAMNLNQDNVRYPEAVSGFLGFLWGQLHEGEIDPDRAQQMFDELGKWISLCESSQPLWKPWNV